MRRPLVMAHRGGPGLYPENTLAAFAHAASLGVDAHELDVHLTADGVPVIHHDARLNPDLARMNGRWLDGPGPRLADLTCDDLRLFDVGRARPGGRFARAHPRQMAADGERVPALADLVRLLKRTAPDQHLFIELKVDFADPAARARGPALADAVLSVLAAEDAMSMATLIGFDWPSVLHAKARAPHVPVWLTCLPERWFGPDPVPPAHHPPGPAELAWLRAEAAGAAPWAAGFDAHRFGGSQRRAIAAAEAQGWFPFHADVTAERLAEARALGLQAGAWTVNDPDEMERLIALGIDAICTDEPDVLLTRLSRA